jgi:hypothetical protein
MPKRREIDNREATVPEADTRIGGDPMPGVIGPAVPLGISEQKELSLVDTSPAPTHNDAGDSAHSTRG